VTIPPRVVRAVFDQPDESEMILNHSLAQAKIIAESLVAFAGGATIDQAMMFSFFSHEVHYSTARRHLDSILHQDRDDFLALALDAGFPIEAPVGFAMGTPLCSAALIGAPRCIALLAQRRAELDTLNQHGQSSLDIACEECGESPVHILCARALSDAGAATTRRHRQAARDARLDDAEIDASYRAARPLGALMISSLGREWDDVVGWAKLHGSDSGQAVADAAERLLALQTTLHLGDNDFLGAALDSLLARHQLPSAIESARMALIERGRLSSSVRACGAPNARTRRGL
jgi:hypothetical protein